MDGIMIAEPLLDFFPLGGQDHALPFHHAGALAILGHDIGALIEDLDQAVGLGPFEAKRRQLGRMLFHSL